MVENDDPDLSELEALDPKILESCTFEEGYFNPGGSDSEEDGDGARPRLPATAEHVRALPRTGDEPQFGTKDT